MATIVVVDARNIISAAFHAQWGSFKTDEEVAERFDPTNFKAFGTMLRTLTGYLRKWPVDELVMAADSRCVARYEILPTYKGHRKKFEVIEKHKNDCLDMLRFAFPVRWLKLKGYEADDIMARFAERYHGEHQVVLVTSDRDMVQVTQAFPSVIMYDHVQKRNVNPDEFPHSMIDYKAITGCTTDNIKSVTGEVTAGKLLSGDMDFEAYLNDGVTKTEKLPRREVYERNRRLVSLIGEYAILPALSHFGFEPCSEIEFDSCRATEVVSELSPDIKVGDIVQAWSAWLVERMVRKQGLGVVDIEGLNFG